MVGAGAGFGLDEFEPVDDRADGATAFLCDLRDGEFLDKVKFENGPEAGMLAAGAGVEVVENDANTAGEVLVGSFGDLGNEVGEESLGIGKS